MDNSRFYAGQIWILPLHFAKSGYAPLRAWPYVDDPTLKWEKFNIFKMHNMHYLRHVKFVRI